ncbi:monocarboxylate transporter 12-like [Argopecten irradians]|uniref:monocarboxylate transporter 12-like n=1 Tax=Argopecten irradians TaxID=31199 RepID=UPI0037248648
MGGSGEEKESEEKEKDEDEEEREEDDPNKQTDQGWAWMVLIGATIESFMIVGFLRSFGIFFVEFLVTLNTNASILSLSLSVQTLVFSVLTLFTLTMSEILDAHRSIVMIGGLLAFFSYFLSSFVRKAELLILTIGLVFGSAAAFAHGPATVMLGKYFDKKRGMANAFMNFGGSTGGLVLPNLFRLLLDEYLLQGTLWITAALLLNIMVTGALLRPLKRQRIQKKVTKSESKTVRNGHFNNVIYKPVKDTAASVGQSYDRLVLGHSNGQNKAWQERKYQMLQAGRRRTVSDSGVTTESYALRSRFHKSTELSQGLGDALGSLGNIHLSVPSDDDDNDSVYEEDTCVSRCHKLTCRNVLGNVLDLRLLKNKLFLMNLTSSMCSVSGLALVVTYIPHHARDVGLTDQQNTQLLTIIGCTDLLNKLILVFIADNKKIKRHFLVAASLIITAIATILIPYCTQFWSLAVYSVIYGTFHGTFFAMLAVLVVDFVGIANISQGLAITMLSHGVSICVFNPVVGAIRDNFLSYDLAFYLMGGFMLFGGILLFLEPKIRQYEERGKNEDMQADL